jgi:hypothetical protein
VQEELFFMFAEKSATIKKRLPYMTLADECLRELEGLSRTADGQAQPRGHAAADLADAGQDEVAREFPGDLLAWRGGLQIYCNIVSAAVIFDS